MINVDHTPGLIASWVLVCIAAPRLLCPMSSPASRPLWRTAYARGTPSDRVFAAFALTVELVALAVLGGAYFSHEEAFQTSAFCLWILSYGHGLRADLANDGGAAWSIFIRSLILAQLFAFPFLVTNVKTAGHVGMWLLVLFCFGYWLTRRQVRRRRAFDELINWR